MIKTTNLNKYFFKRKKNEIHVINNISIELPQKGLVALFGPSGGGKTTLLNVIGGLDKADGHILFDEHEFSNYNMAKWDKMRSKDIGYVFQNYLLIHELSVYENIKMTLEMIGMTDKQMINNRIDYLLESVGLKNYKRRRAGQLSGGQQQRVAIARALAKNPKVIIADEPTGNLDSKNTEDIMTIIKKISEEKLVLLVTHEQALADYYADRILEVKDGQIISDTLNEGEKNYDFTHQSDIYLGDLEKKNVSVDNVNIDLYGEFDTKNIKLINKDGTIYIDFGKKEKIVILDSDSETKLYEGTKEQQREEKISTFDFDRHFEEPKKHKNHRFITFKQAFKLAFNEIITSGRRRKFLLIGFLFAGALIALMSSLLVIGLDERNTMFNAPKQRMTLDSKSALDKGIIQSENITSVFLPISHGFHYTDTLFNQVPFAPSFNAEIISMGAIKHNIIHGRNISNVPGSYEMVVDYSALQYLLNYDYFFNIGYEAKDIVGKEIRVLDRTFTIVGITQYNYGYVVMNYEDYKVIAYGVTLPTDAERIAFFDDNILDVGSFVVFSNVPNQVKENLVEKGIDVTYNYDKLYAEHRRNILAGLNVLLMVILVIAGLVWLSLYFIIRSNLFSRIDEIKVYRALGVKRGEIVKIYFVEVLVMTTLTTVVGFFLMLYILVNNQFFGEELILTSTLQIIGSLVVIYGFNILFGTLPVMSLLRKTPAAIIAQAEA